MPFPCLAYTGNRRIWTEERVLEALRRAATEIQGPLPCVDSGWNRIKKGRLDWPGSNRVLEYFGSMGRAWLAAGADKSRVSLRNIAWTPEEDEYILENAGTMTLQSIGRHLCRSYGSVRVRLQAHGVRARSNNGYFSAAELAKEFRCPYHRVRKALHDGVISGRYDRIRNRWGVDLAQLTPAALEILRAPKTHSYKNSPSDLGDYLERHGLRRRLINGVLTIVAVRSN